MTKRPVEVAVDVPHFLDPRGSLSQIHYSFYVVLGQVLQVKRTGNGPKGSCWCCCCREQIWQQHFEDSTWWLAGSKEDFKVVASCLSCFPPHVTAKISFPLPQLHWLYISTYSSLAGVNILSRDTPRPWSKLLAEKNNFTPGPGSLFGAVIILNVLAFFPNPFLLFLQPTFLQHSSGLGL